jgi:hypothetical protein
MRIQYIAKQFVEWRTIHHAVADDELSGIDAWIRIVWFDKHDLWTEPTILCSTTSFTSRGNEPVVAGPTYCSSPEDDISQAIDHEATKKRSPHTWPRDTRLYVGVTITTWNPRRIRFSRRSGSVIASLYSRSHHRERTNPNLWKRWLVNDGTNPRVLKWDRCWVYPA